MQTTRIEDKIDAAADRAKKLVAMVDEARREVSDETESAGLDDQGNCVKNQRDFDRFVRARRFVVRAVAEYRVTPESALAALWSGGTRGVAGAGAAREADDHAAKRRIDLLLERVGDS